MNFEWIIVGAFILYAVIYLGRYIVRALKGKKTGCGCSSGSGCSKTGTAGPKK